MLYSSTNTHTNDCGRCAKLNSAQIVTIITALLSHTSQSGAKKALAPVSAVGVTLRLARRLASVAREGPIDYEGRLV